MKNEIWKPIPDFPNYSISNKGRVMRTVNSGNARAGDYLKPWIESSGYLQVELNNHPIQKTFRVHRIVLSVFVRPHRGKEICNHKDGDKKNNCVENLEWCSSGYNMRHAYKTGLHGKLHGELSHYAKLKEKDVLMIRSLITSGTRSIISIAHEYGVSRYAIYYIRDRRTWVHI